MFKLHVGFQEDSKQFVSSECHRLERRMQAMVGNGAAFTLCAQRLEASSGCGAIAEDLEAAEPT